MTTTTAKVTEKLTENGVYFEIYADGDCVIQVDKPGFFQISQDVISKIYKSRKLHESSDLKSNPLQSILDQPSLIKRYHQNLGAIPKKSEPKVEFSPEKDMEDDAFQYVSEPLSSKPSFANDLQVNAANPEVDTQIKADADAFLPLETPLVDTPDLKPDQSLSSDELIKESDVIASAGNKAAFKKALVIETFASEEKSQNDDADDEDRIRRSLVAPTPESAGWSCTMRIKGKEPILYKYISRRFARAADPSDEIGQNGRIS